MSNADIKKFATELAQVLSDIGDKKIEGRAILDAAKEQGINTKALNKVAKEMLKDSEKFRQQYDAESQLDLFRSAVGIYRMKGLDGDFREAAE